jgi:hypothetical protein
VCRGPRRRRRCGPVSPAARRARGPAGPRAPRAPGLPTPAPAQSDILDWHGDHPFTNFHDTFNTLVDAGYYLEVLSSPVTCVDLRNYG